MLKWIKKKIDWQTHLIDKNNEYLRSNPNIAWNKLTHYQIIIFLKTIISCHNCNGFPSCQCTQL